MVMLRCGLPAILVAALVVNATDAADYLSPPRGGAARAATSAGYGGPAAVRPVSHASPQPPAYSGAPQAGRYPQLNAPLYPGPVQNVPPWTGGTIVTNQAFAPHEMLYPHDYHAMYPPFYYKVHGGWVVTPFGVRQHESWKLQGTDVRIKYRGHIPLFAGFIPPRHD